VQCADSRFLRAREGPAPRLPRWHDDVDIKLMHKLDIHDTATLVRYAIRRGLTRP
jgi:hypothetical protein